MSEHPDRREPDPPEINIQFGVDVSPAVAQLRTALAAVRASAPGEQAAQ